MRTGTLVRLRRREEDPSYVRDYAISRRSYSVPTNETLRTIAELGSVVSIGAGVGYWQHLPY